MIAFRQFNPATPQTPQSTVTVAYPAAQTAGNLNLVAIGWSTPSVAVTGVSDSSGNVYAVAAGPTVQPGVQTQVIYIAPNIRAAAANVVKVTFGGAVSYPDVRIAEYSGLDPVNPLDQAAATMGAGTTSASPAVTTTNATDLLVGVNNVNSVTTGAGAGYTSRGITGDGNILEDRVVTAVGAYTATATIISGDWVMQIVALRAASAGGDTTAPTAPTNVGATAASSSQINLSWTASTDNAGVTAYRVERCQGAGCASFAEIGTTATTSYNETGLTGGTSYSYRVRATAVSSTRIDLAWTASTDNVGVTRYRIERCQGTGCTTFAQVATPTGPTFSDTVLTASRTYRYRVRAADGENNLSAYSATMSATTPAALLP